MTFDCFPRSVLICFSKLGAQIMALKHTKMEILLQLFSVVTTGKNFGQLELGARILPNIAKPLKNSAILPGNCQSGKIDVAEWQTSANHTICSPHLTWNVCDRRNI
jgi:hypothetical protein